MGYQFSLVAVYAFIIFIKFFDSYLFRWVMADGHTAAGFIDVAGGRSVLKPRHCNDGFLIIHNDGTLFITQVD